MKLMKNTEWWLINFSRKEPCLRCVLISCEKSYLCHLNAHLSQLLVWRLHVWLKSFFFGSCIFLCFLTFSSSTSFIDNELTVGFFAFAKFLASLYKVSAQ